MIAFSSKSDVPVQKYLDHLVWMASSGKRAPHPHGWGYFLMDSTGFVSIVKSPRPIFVDSPKTNLKAKIGLFHARKASKGTIIDADSTHPYIIYNGKIHVLIHNGGIADGFESPTTGVDTEYILRTIVERSVKDAYCQLSKLKASSITFVYFDGEKMYVLKHRTKLPEYYTLFYKVEGGVFVVASEPMDDDWKEMENGELIVVKDGSILERSVIGCT